jgi:hypothetical protein
LGITVRRKEKERVFGDNGKDCTMLREQVRLGSRISGIPQLSSSNLS